MKKTSIKLDCRLKVFIYVIFCFQRGFHTSFPPLIFVFKDVFLIYNLVTQKICYCEIICQSHVGCSFFYLQRRMCVNFLEYLIKFFKYKFHFHRRQQKTIILLLQQKIFLHIQLSMKKVFRDLHFNLLCYMHIFYLTFLI